MIDALATLARFAQVASGSALAGWLMFQLVRPPSGPDAEHAARLRRCTLTAGGIYQAAAAVALACQSALVTGQQSALFAPGQWWQVSVDTLYGRIWWLRAALMMVAMLIALAAARTAAGPVLIMALCTLAAAAGPAAGHAAALEPAWPGVLAAGVHLAALSVWWGGLLPLSLALGGADSPAAFTAVLRRFSRMATPCMGLLLLSGTYLAIEHVDRWPALFGTRYGHLLLLKVALIGVLLALAATLRWYWLRVAPASEMRVLSVRPPIVVLIEWAFATIVLLIAAVLSGTPPARHEQVDWWFSFRLAPEIALSRPENIPWLVGAGALLVLAALLLVAGWRRVRRPRLLSVATLCGAGAAGLALPHLGVPAYPDTYRTSEVPYHAISIRAGAALFQRHCAECHGTGGLGDGPQAARLSVPPADLSAPHTADHTAGDMFWWLSHGMPSGAMPGFAHRLDVEARWDLINFLRTFANGYQARIIRPQVAPAQPWLGAPDFNFLTQGGDSGALRDLRTRSTALLVFYTWPTSEARLRQLAATAWLGDQTRVLAMPLDAAKAGDPASIPLPVVVQGGEEAVAAYLLLRRTLANADSGDRAPPPGHMEMLIDRFGYLRARWLPAEGDGWNDPEMLRAQLRLLQAEPEILPPPDEHIH